MEQQQIWTRAFSFCHCHHLDTLSLKILQDEDIALLSKYLTPLLWQANFGGKKTFLLMLEKLFGYANVYTLKKLYE